MASRIDERLRAQLARRASVLGEIRRILVEELRLPMPADAIDPDVMIFGTGLGLDSVDEVELVVLTEQRFDVVLPSTVMHDGLRTVNTLVDLVLALSPKAGDS
jgi:acyl carrier protein